MLLAHVDGVGDGQVVGDALAPVGLVALLGCQPVVEGCQAGRLERGAGQDAVAQDEACSGRKATQRVTCANNEEGLSQIEDSCQPVDPRRLDCTISACPGGYVWNPKGGLVRATSTCTSWFH